MGHPKKNIKTSKNFNKVLSMDQRGKVKNALYGNGVEQTFTYWSDSGLIRRASVVDASQQSLQYMEFEWGSVGNLRSRHEIKMLGHSKALHFWGSL